MKDNELKFPFNIQLFADDVDTTDEPEAETEELEDDELTIAERMEQEEFEEVEEEEVVDPKALQQEEDETDDEHIDFASMTDEEINAITDPFTRRLAKSFRKEAIENRRNKFDMTVSQSELSPRAKKLASDFFGDYPADKLPDLLKALGTLEKSTKRSTATTGGVFATKKKANKPKIGSRAYGESLRRK